MSNSLFFCCRNYLQTVNFKKHLKDPGLTVQAL
jgi:hypothetical protein